MVRITWDIDGTVKGLREILERLRDLRPAWQSVLAYIRKATQQQFESEGARGGSPWAPLSEPYRTRKAARFPGKTILRRTDKLFRSLTNPDDPYSVEESNPKSLTYGTIVPYGAYHQGRKRGRRLPVRKFLVVTEQDRQEVKARVRQYLEGSARLAGFQRSI